MKIISAGGVVYRNGDNGLEIQMIQDRFGRITVPKGKMEPGETVEETAIREIAEETGISGRIIKPLETVSYTDRLREGGPMEKEVHYFLVEAVGGTLQAQVEEIRGVEWLKPEEAWRLQRRSGYDNNDSVLRGALSELGVEVNE